jgi:hypothetical protein
MIFFEGRFLHPTGPGQVVAHHETGSAEPFPAHEADDRLCTQQPLNRDDGYYG